VCVVGVNGRLFILTDEIYFELWFLYVDIDFMRVYAVGGDGNASSYLGVYLKVMNIL
jgi:hypothetical protein